MNILLTGATGMVGSEVLRQAIDDPKIEHITVLSRRPAPVVNEKVRQIIHRDFTTYAGLEEVFRDIDACLWCLGISQSRVSKSEYYSITYEYTVAAATAMVKANANMTFIFLSGEGADSKERSPVRFARIKGKAENALLRAGFLKLYIFRPGGILASTPVSAPSAFKRLESLVVRIMRAVFPWSVVSSKELALAMLKVAKDGYQSTILSHRAIKALPV